MRNRVQRSIRLAMTNKINIHYTVSIGYFAVAGEAIKYKGESLIALYVARTFEEFIQHRADQILRR